MRKAIVALAVAACARAALAVECTSAKPGVKAAVREAGFVWSDPDTDGQRSMQYRMLALPSDFKACAKE